MAFLSSQWVVLWMVAGMLGLALASGPTGSSSSTGVDKNGLPFVSLTGILTDETRQFVDSVMRFSSQCDQASQSRLFMLYYKNKQLIEQCGNESNYVIFPNAGVPPTDQQLKGLVESVACLQVFTAVVHAQLAECNLQAFCPRSASEVLLRIHHDMVLDKRKAPSGQQFIELCYYNIAVNLLQMNQTIYDTVYSNDSMATSFPLDALDSARSKMLLMNNVHLGHDLVIRIGPSVQNDAGQEATPPSPSPSSSTASTSPAGANTSSSHESSGSNSFVLVVLLAVVASVLVHACISSRDARPSVDRTHNWRCWSDQRVRLRWPCRVSVRKHCFSSKEICKVGVRRLSWGVPVNCSSRWLPNPIRVQQLRPHELAATWVCNSISDIRRSWSCAWTARTPHEASVATPLNQSYRPRPSTPPAAKASHNWSSPPQTSTWGSFFHQVGRMEQ